MENLDILQPPEEAYLEDLASRCVETLYDHYFRCQIVSPENIPRRKDLEGPSRIFIPNHSGMAFPWDAIMFGYGLGMTLKEQEHRQFKDMPRSLTAPALSHMPQMAPYFIPGWWKKGGGVDATFKNFDLLLSHGYDIIIYPEGVPGIGKGFNKRYQLQRFSSSVMKMAVKHNAQIVPVCVVNGEYINPLAYNVEFVNRIAQSMGIPYMPISPLTPIALTFPFMFYSALPAQLNFIFQPPVDIEAMTGGREYDDIAEDEFQDFSIRLREHVQERLDQGVKDCGRRPFKWFNFLSHFLFKSGRKKIYCMPFMWPEMFQSQWHRYHGGQGSVGLVQRFLRMLPYITPFFGWLILFYLNWPRIAQKSRTIKFAMSKNKSAKSQRLPSQSTDTRDSK